jgi:hypothetical protein
MFWNFEKPKLNPLTESFLNSEGVDSSHFEMVRKETDEQVELAWGKYDYGVDKIHMEPDSDMLWDACHKFNEVYKGKYVATKNSSDKFHYIHISIVK